MITKPVIAYIDDDDDDALIFSEAFSLAGHSQYSIVAFYSGEALLSSLKANSVKPSMFVLDMNMPKMNGLELAAALRTIPEHSNTPIVILSTGITPTESKALEEMNIKSIKKPLVLAEWTTITTLLMQCCDGFISGVHQHTPIK